MPERLLGQGGWSLIHVFSAVAACLPVLLACAVDPATPEDGDSTETHRLVEARFVDAEGLQSYRLAYTYVSGTRIDTVNKYDACDTLCEIRAHTYDAEDRLLGIDVNDADGELVRSFAYAHNEDGTLATETEHASDGAVSAVWSFVYQSGLLSAKELYSAEDELIRTVSYEYDDSERLIAVDYLDCNGACEHTTLYSYDEEGDVVRIASLNGDGFELCCRELVRTVDDVGNVTRIDYHDYYCDDLVSSVEYVWEEIPAGAAAEA